MGMLTDDDSLVEAAVSELLGQAVEDKLQLDPEGQVTYLMTQHSLVQVCQFNLYNASLMNYPGKSGEGDLNESKCYLLSTLSPTDAK
jgi:hypothetical protein